jgi:hypothetical protein
MKRISIVVCVIIVLGLLAGVSAWSQSVQPQDLEEIRAKVRAEVKREMGVREPEKPDVQQKEQRVAPHLRTRLEIMQQGALVLLVLALIPAVIAKVKGRSFIAWYVLGLLLWIVAFPASVFMRKLPEAGGKKEETEEADIYAKIGNLSKLKEKGLISENEFNSKKKELLDRI